MMEFFEKANKKIDEVEGKFNNVMNQIPFANSLAKEILNFPLVKAYNESRWNKFAISRSGRMIMLPGILFFGGVDLYPASHLQDGAGGYKETQTQPTGESATGEAHLEKAEVSLDMHGSAKWMNDSIAKASIEREINLITTEWSEHGVPAETMTVTFDHGEGVVAESASYLPNKMTITVTFPSAEPFQCAEYFSDPMSKDEIGNVLKNLANPLEENELYDIFEQNEGSALIAQEESNANLGRELFAFLPHHTESGETIVDFATTPVKPE